MFVSPMLLQELNQPIDDPNTIVELKFDGIRLILSKHKGQVKLFTRHRTEITHRFQELSNLDIPDGTILDGELVSLDDEGKPDFHQVMSRFMSHKSPHPVQFVSFDILSYGETPLHSLPLLERKRILSTVIHEASHPLVHVISYYDRQACDYFQIIKENQLEGIVIKKADSPYKIGKRTNYWNKVINYQYTNALITGYSHKEFGLLLTTLDNKPLGVCKFMATPYRKQLYQMAHLQDSHEKNGYTFLNKPLPCKIRFRNFTSAGMLRLPVFEDWLV